MKLNLIVIAFAICIYGVQSHAVPGSSEISPTQTLKNKLEITHSERSLIPDLQYLVALILNGLGDVVRLLLPPGQDLYHVIAKGLQKVVRWFVHDNEPLLELLDKLIVAGENIARVAINSAIRILLGQPLVTFIV
ncbi:uncharacterized protein LOC114331187 isoform X5 [Diabrotica virgifera virgifera]|uniref:Uncharacterized protein n=1 Tax=Diabrotica virgifera virgifera TaxID=50390 RepID=A0ABM5KE22_DIAVI|nr:uncharacterized protein LOC114331187 isoform X5 [Diabrotica virgifera virgifera]